MHLSAGHLSRQLRLAYGQPPYAYLMTRVIERAMALVQEPTDQPDGLRDCFRHPAGSMIPIQQKMG